MKFRTEITITPSEGKIDHHSRILSLGSCFAEEVASRLQREGIATLSSPMGVLFNPLSIERCVWRISRCERVCEGELHQRGDVWFCYDTHGDFDRVGKESALWGINSAIEDAYEWLQETDTVILTLGTAWVYEREGEVVANCHKMPAREFVRRRLSVEEVAGSLRRTVEMLAPKRVILTVSPVRHVADGLEGNSLSKATLRLAAEEVAESNERVEYFPSYEILVDDLRDYRYYADDMVHPSRVAVEYVWERFKEAYMSGQTVSMGERFARLTEAAEHRPLHPESEEHQHFRETMYLRAKELLELFPDNPIVAKLTSFFAPK